MYEQIGCFLLRVGDAHLHALADHRTDIANLTARLGIERGLVEND
jgi:hypothetical protein